MRAEGSLSMFTVQGSLWQEEKGDKAETENHDQGWLLVEGEEGAAARLAQTHSQHLVLQNAREGISRKGTSFSSLTHTLILPPLPHSQDHRTSLVLFMTIQVCLF